MVIASLLCILVEVNKTMYGNNEYVPKKPLVSMGIHRQERAGELGFLTANNCLGFKTPQKYAYRIPLYFRNRCWKNDMFSFQIEASHLHIGLKWLCQPEIGYTTLHFVSNQHTQYHIDFALFINNGGRT
jgi:hypothetical protein